MSSTFDAGRLEGRTALDRAGNKIGKIGQVYADEQAGQPTWITVHTGLLGTGQSIAPLLGASDDGENVVLAVDRELVKQAPDVADAADLQPAEKEALHRHYARYLDAGGAAAGSGDETGVPDEDEGRAGTGAATGEDAIALSEERLRAVTERVEAGQGAPEELFDDEDEGRH